MVDTREPVGNMDVATRHDPSRELLGVVGVHAGLVFVPVLLVGVVVLPVLVALVLALLAAGLVTAWRLRGVDDRIATQLGARPADLDTAPRRLAVLVENVAMVTGVEEPRLFLIEDPAANAIVWGVGTRPHSVAVTTGLLEAAEPIELEGIVAQLLVSTGAGVERATLAAALFGGLAGTSLAPTVAALAAMSVEDRRVVHSDLEAVRCTQYPPGYVAALVRVGRVGSHVSRSPRALQALWLAEPQPRQPDDPFAIHPPLADRIDLLREL